MQACELQNWCRYLKAQLGGPTRGEYEALKAENEELRSLVEQLRQLVPEQPPVQVSGIVHGFRNASCDMSHITTPQKRSTSLGGQPGICSQTHPNLPKCESYRLFKGWMHAQVLRKLLDQCQNFAVRQDWSCLTDDIRLSRLRATQAVGLARGRMHTQVTANIKHRDLEIPRDVDQLFAYCSHVPMHGEVQQCRHPRSHGAMRPIWMQEEAAPEQLEQEAEAS